MVINWSCNNTNRQQIPALYLYEFVSPLQAVLQFPLCCLPVIFVVLPGSVGILFLLRLLPQLLPSISELRRQRRHRLTVTVLLMLVKKQTLSITLMTLQLAAI